MTDRSATDTSEERGDPDRPTVVSIIGPSDAGKTSLVEALVSAFEDRRVATVKSIHHDIEPDTPGTDTHRHRTAGADTVVGITPAFTFEITRGGKGSDRTDTATELAALGATLDRLASRVFDIVLVEGFGAAPLPTIRVGEGDGTATGAGTDPDPNRIGTGDESIGTLRAAIEDTDPVEPGTLPRR